jgi:hypothetical protein
LLESSASDESETEEPTLKYKSSINFGQISKLDFEQDSEKGSKHYSPYKQSENPSKRSNKNLPAYHDDGQSTHVSSRESCIGMEYCENFSHDKLRSEIIHKENNSAPEKTHEMASLRSTSLESAKSLHSFDTPIGARNCNNYNLI